MTREELQNKLGDAICEYCNKNIISEYNIGIGGLAKWRCQVSSEDEYCLWSYYSSVRQEGSVLF